MPRIVRKLDEQHNDLLYMFTNANLLPFPIMDDTTLAGPRSKGILSYPGYRIPDENRNPPNFNQAQNGTVNATDNINQAENGPVNNGQNEATNIGGANIVGGGGGGANNDQNQRMVIYRYELNGQDLHINLAEQIQTNVIANDCQSWNDLAENILQVWRQRNTCCISPMYDHVTPANCWPRAETIFGHRSHGLFQSLNWRIIENFELFKMDLNCLLVIENVNGFANGVANFYSQIEGGKINVFMYNFQHEDMEINLVKDFVWPTPDGPLTAFRSWPDVAYGMYYAFTREMQIEFNPLPSYHNMDAANCWPGADTIFENRVHGRFNSLNWPTYVWEDVRYLLNSLLLIRYQFEE